MTEIMKGILEAARDMFEIGVITDEQMAEFQAMAFRESYEAGFEGATDMTDATDEELDQFFYPSISMDDHTAEEALAKLLEAEKRR